MAGSPAVIRHIVVGDESPSSAAAAAVGGGAALLAQGKHALGADAHADTAVAIAKV